MTRKRAWKRARADAQKQTHKKGKRPQKKELAASQPSEASASPGKTEEQDEDCSTELIHRKNEEDTDQVPPETAQTFNDDQAAKAPDGKIGKPDAPNQMKHRGIHVQTQTDLVPQMTQETQTDFTETTVRTQGQTQPGTKAASEGTEPSPPEREPQQGSLKKEGDIKGKHSDKVSEKDRKQETSEKDTDTASEGTNPQETSENQEGDVERMDTDADGDLGSSTDPPAGRKSYAQATAGNSRTKETQNKPIR